MPEVICFRRERGADLKRVQDELTLDPAVIRNLNQGEHVVYSRDRFKKVNSNGTMGTGMGEDQTRHADPVHSGEVRQPVTPVAEHVAQGVARGAEGTPGGESGNP